MESRRDFLKKAALLSGATGLMQALPASIQKAMAIDPAPGSTYLDAEHIVVLMQENRSFDHCYGTLQGVRGYNDPRALVKPDKNLVWLQKNASGETYAPFRLNLQHSNATWLGSLPHSWTNQVDARNGGRYDKWLEAKPSGHEGFAGVPLTMGYYSREDIPFYYALADAFTVCDQNFCSSLTGTTPNRLYLWSGTVRAEQHKDSFAHLRNEDVDHFVPAAWKTYPERLEENNISWKIYQNEISLPSGLTGDEDAWLSNFTDNPLEFFSQYQVPFAASYRDYIKKLLADLPGEITALNEKIQQAAPGSKEAEKWRQELAEKQVWLSRAREGVEMYTEERYAQLTQQQRNLHEKAFSINKTDAAYRQLQTLRYTDQGISREMKVPAGDVLYQFRHDVDNDQLPAISWIVGPENFSDHPGAPWYGAWYVSEIMDILTRRPEVWKKTIFILCYDENDGYFDHVPPFVAPDPRDRNTGHASAGIDTAVEFVTLEQDRKKYAGNHARESAIGLGYRVPLVIASPWSRGGAVCSQVFDHTSILQFMETFIQQKWGKQVRETNISQWRRTVCGDLTAVFKPYDGAPLQAPAFPGKAHFLENIHNARFKQNPSGYMALSAAAITAVNSRTDHGIMPLQEKGIRPACALPYQLFAMGALDKAKKIFAIILSAGREPAALQAAGAPFTVYAYTGSDCLIRSYAVAAGDSLTDTWNLDAFHNGHYHLSVYGPNGFFREFRGSAADPGIAIAIEYDRYTRDKNEFTGNIRVRLNSSDHCRVTIQDNAYKGISHSLDLHVQSRQKRQEPLLLDLSRSFGWYDFSVHIAGNALFEQRYAGHVETGKPGFTDPFMGGII